VHDPGGSCGQGAAIPTAKERIRRGKPLHPSGKDNCFRNPLQNNAGTNDGQ